ncbi:MAG: SDR family oxidoreductase [Nanoarchaeota archaeon]|nr:SDR family oxidoreductase [Nanoarchaeota archaeon]
MIKKSVLITGSSKGIGASLALNFSKNNYDIILHGRDEANLKKIQDKILRNGVNCDSIKGDIKSYKTIENLYKIAKKRDISILINNAGIDHKNSLENTSFKDIENVLKVNLIAPIKLTKKIYPIFLKKNSGIIININSLDSLKIPEYKSIYCASKEGLKGFTDSLRFEAKKEGIRVIGIYIGGVKTDTYARTGKNMTTCMEPSDVSQIVWDICKPNQSASIENIIINRVKY